MGHKFSALKKIRNRKASERARCPSTLSEATNESLSREDDYAVSTSNGVESTKSNSVDTFSEALLPIPEPEVESAPITLPKLCTELLLDIAENLPPSSYMSLSYACPTLRNKIGVSFAQVLGDRDLSGSTLSIESRNVRYLERLELWNMLVRDGKIPWEKASYSGDETKIITAGYSKDGRPFYSIIKIPLYVPISTEHRWLGTKGVMWLCPHRAFDYHSATTKSERNDTHKCGSILVSSSIPLIAWWIMRIPAKSVPTSKEVMDALRPLNAPICPHLRLNDASVGRMYDPKCRNLHSTDLTAACPCSMCLSKTPLSVACSYCDTSLMFGIEYDGRDRERFYLLIMRSDRLGRSCTDRDWIAQVARPTDLEDYEKAWEATSVECSRRMGLSSDDLWG